MVNNSFLLLFLFLFFSTSACIRAGGVNWKILIYSNCSPDIFSTDNPFKNNLDSVLSCLANSAGFSPYNNFTSSPVYGLYQCRFDVSMSDCEACISFAISWLSCRCPNAKSAAVQLHGCLVRYGDENFVERPGKEVMFKRCGPSGGEDVMATTETGPSGGEDVMAMMETVFDMLESGKELYRIGRSGYVGGSAQCVGDQSPRHCKTCLKVALEELRSTCYGGSAISGEVYLDKCFVEYSLQGTSCDRRPRRRERHRGHASEVGKDIAIITGIVAVVLFSTLSLNYLKKSADGKDAAGRREQIDEHEESKQSSGGKEPADEHEERKEIIWLERGAAVDDVTPEEPLKNP